MIKLKIKQIIKEECAQSSVELILLLAGIIMIVIIIMNFYQDYLINWAEEINNTEVNKLNDEIDKLNDYIK